jgi:hypothetical protein
MDAFPSLGKGWQGECTERLLGCLAAGRGPGAIPSPGAPFPPLLQSALTALMSHEKGSSSLMGCLAALAHAPFPPLALMDFWVDGFGN